MSATRTLSPKMTVTAFSHGYWYATELRAFAVGIGIPSASKLRKDELEQAVVAYLRTGRTGTSTARRVTTAGPRDVQRGLRLDLPIVSYTNDKTTKAFLEREARKVAPGLKRRSGARYRLNRWREGQLAKGVLLTYGDLIREYVRLNQGSEPFARIPHGRYINFISDFLAAEQGVTRADATAAWNELKRLDAPKTYSAWTARRRRHA